MKATISFHDKNKTREGREYRETFSKFLRGKTPATKGNEAIESTEMNGGK